MRSCPVQRTLHSSAAGSRLLVMDGKGSLYDLITQLNMRTIRVWTRQPTSQLRVQKAGTFWRIIGRTNPDRQESGLQDAALCWVVV